MSELPKQLPSWPPSTLGWSTPTAPAPGAVVGWRDTPTPRVPMRPSDFAGFTEEGRACFARILRRAVECNRKGAL